MKNKVIKISFVIMVIVFGLIVGYVYAGFNSAKIMKQSEEDRKRVIELNQIILDNLNKIEDIYNEIDNKYKTEIQKIVAENDKARKELEKLGGKAPKWEGHEFLDYTKATFFAGVDAKEETKTAEIDRGTPKQIKSSRGQCCEFTNDYNAFGWHCGDTYESKSKNIQRSIEIARVEDIFIAKCGNINDEVSVKHNRIGHIGFIAYIDKQRCYYLLDSNRVGTEKKDVRKVCKGEYGYVDIVGDNKCLLVGAGDGKIKWNDELKSLFIKKTGLNIFEDKKESNILFNNATITTYNPVESQTDSSPCINSSTKNKLAKIYGTGNLCELNKKGIRTVALPQDRLAYVYYKLGIKPQKRVLSVGDKIFLSGSNDPRCSGEFVVGDAFNKRYNGKEKVDIFMADRKDNVSCYGIKVEII